MKIRLATTDDLDALAKLVAAFYAEQAERFDLPRMEAAMLAIIRHGIATDQAVWVAVHDDGSIVGWCARVMAPGLPQGQAVGAKWVFKPFRRERVCADMTREADAHAARLGATVLTGEVAKDNEAGWKSALADGWEIVGYAIRKRLEHETCAQRSVA